MYLYRFDITRLFPSSESECVFIFFSTTYCLSSTRNGKKRNTGAFLYCTIKGTTWPPPSARRVSADHCQSNFERELSLKTLRVKDELQESNGQSHTLTSRCVCVFVAAHCEKSTGTSPLLKMRIDDCTLRYPLLCTALLMLFWKGLEGSLAHAHCEHVRIIS